MKKLVSIICIIVLLVVTTFPVSAVDDGNQQTMSEMEMTAKRINAELFCKSKDEVAKNILREFGMPENLVSGVSVEDLDMVYNSKTISVNSQYGKVNSDGEVTLLTEEEAIIEKEKRNNNKDEPSARTIDPETNGQTGTDTMFHKFLFALESTNSPSGTVGIISAFYWLDEPLYRCWDVVAITGVNIVINVQTTKLTVVYTEQIEDLYLSSTTVSNIEENFDFGELDEKGDALYNGNFIGAKFDMPEDSYLPTMLWMYNNIGVLLSVRANVTHPELVTNFSATGWYFHQKAGIEWDVSLSKDAVSLNISPKIFYDDPHQIQVTTTYSP